MGIDYSLVSGLGVKVDLTALRTSRGEYDSDTAEYIQAKYPGVALLSASGYDMDNDWVLVIASTATYDDMRSGGGWVEPQRKPFTTGEIEDFVRAYAEITGKAWEVGEARSWFVGLDVW